MSLTSLVSRVSVILFAAASIWGCSKQIEGPPTLVVDRSECARCKMLISDTRFASSLKTSKYLIYDDIGCMLDDIKTNVYPQTQDLWFRDYLKDEWIGAKQALFYLLDSRTTPMGYGYIAIAGDKTKPSLAIPETTYIGTIEQLRVEHTKKADKP